MKSNKLLWLLLTIGFLACETEQLEDQLNMNSEENTETVDAVDLSIAVDETEDVLDDISMYSGYFFGINDTSTNKGDDKGRSGFFRECASLDVVEEENQITITLTFEGECEDENGNLITGTIVKTESWTEVSSENSITVDNFSINGYLINGAKSFSYTQSNGNGNPEMGGSVDIAVETEYGTISKVGNKTVEIIEGGDTDTWVDNVKQITGSATYTTFENETFSKEITTPLIKPAACKFIVSGVKEYTTPNGTTTIDFGDGTCDGFATKTAPDGTVSEIILGKKRRKHNDDDNDEDDEDEDDDDDEEDDDEDDDEKDDENDCIVYELVVCETGDTFDGIETFNLEEALGDCAFTQEQTIEFFLSAEDAESGDNPLDAEFTNTENYQVIKIKFTDIQSGEYELIPIELIVDDCNEEDEEEENDEEEDEDETVEDDFDGCILITECGEFEIDYDNIEDLTVAVETVDNAFVIMLINGNQEIVLEKECLEGGEASISCTSIGTDG